MKDLILDKIIQMIKEIQSDYQITPDARQESIDRLVELSVYIKSI